MSPAVTRREEVLERIRSESERFRGLGVRRLGLFGSFARDEATKESDVDLLVVRPSGDDPVWDTQLDELRDRLDNRSVEPRDVSRVLPEAFALRGGGDQQISAVLTPYVENGFITTVRKSPRRPIVGSRRQARCERAMASQNASGSVIAAAHAAA